jgi:hypothetical protein
VSKFLDGARTALSESHATAIVDAVLGLDRLDSCAELLDLVAGRQAVEALR